jgi:hypothetical protein
MKFFNGLIIGIILGVAGYWFVENKNHEHPDLVPRADNSAADARASSSDAAGHPSDSWKARMEALDLRADQVKDELARTGKVFRRKAEDFGAKVSDATADARIVAAIKAKYAVDSSLSVWKISVSATDGHVTLSGSVNTPEDIGRAMAIALGVDGVVDVVSNIQVKPAS